VNILAIDTSTASGSVALLQEGRVSFEKFLEARTTYSEKFMIGLEALLQEAGISIKGVEGVAVARGPGVFTGLRIGIGGGEALAYSLQIPLWGISTLKALASVTGLQEGRVLACMDARKDEFFVGGYEMVQGRAGPPFVKEALVPMEGVHRLGSDPHSSLLVMSEETCLHFKEKGLDWREVVGDRLHIQSLSARIIGQLAWLRHQAQESDEALTLSPCYLKVSDAERRSA